MQSEPKEEWEPLGARRRVEELVPPARPLVRSAPRSAMFLPLVVLVAVLPGLYALRNWDLTPPGPWWGLRGLAVLEGHWLDQSKLSGLGPIAEAEAYRAVALQPPLYAWLEAAVMALSGDRTPLATVLPSYVAGAFVVLLVYLHGRLWRGAGIGMVAAILTGFNRDLLLQMQQATPTTLGLAGTMTALLGYGLHLQAGDGRRAHWTILGGLALGVSLLAVGGLGLLAVPVVLLHQAMLGPDPAPLRRPRRWWRGWRDRPSLWSGAAAVAIGLALAAPWHVLMVKSHGEAFWASLLLSFHAGVGGDAGLAARLLDLAPASLPLALLAAARAIRRILAAEADDPATVGGAFLVAWLAVAALAPALLPGGPRPALNLFLLVPLNLLAAQAMSDLAGRRVRARSLIWLAPATAMAVAWWSSLQLREALASLAHGRLDAATALGLHLGLDLIVGLALATRVLDRWARRRDDRRRLVLGGFLGAVVGLTIASGVREVRFRHRETADLLALRDVIRRRQAERPFTLLAVVGPDPGLANTDGSRPGGRLRFILRSALPNLAQIDLDDVSELPRLPDGQRLVILAGRAQRLSYAAQSRLGLEAIHPGRSGVLDAYATARAPRAPTRREQGRTRR